MDIEGNSAEELETPLDGSFLDVSFETVPSAIQTCQVCNKVFKSKNNLRRHIKTHVNDALFCTLCSRFFKSEDQLKKHKNKF